VLRFALLVVLALALPAAASGATTVSNGTFAYDLEDPNVGIVHFVCDEVRAEGSSGARETIHCVTTDTSLKSAFVFDHAHDFGGYPWFSDFTGQESTDFHLVGTPTGRLDGWATYA
jgi:hypothetical protein